MKTISKIILAFLCLAVGFQSCSEDEVVLASLQVTVNAADAFGNISIDSLYVYAVNTTDNSTDSVLLGADNVAIFSYMAPGIYNVSCSRMLTSDETFAVVGSYNPLITLNAVEANCTLSSGVSSTVSLTLDGSQSSSLVIKEFYYTGAAGGWNILFKDQYIEIYNNSAEVVYADGLYLASIAPQRNGSDKDKNVISTLDNTEFIYADRVSQIPGDGTENPIQPGESIIIAFNANDWTKDNEGYTTVDLSGADFELYATDWLIENGRLGNATHDIDNVDVPNMNIHYLNVENYGSMQFMCTGPSAAIFRIAEPLSTTQDDVIADPEISISDPLYYLPIPVSSIIDGIDMVFDAESASYKKMPASIDAGFGYTSGSAYTGLKVTRKIVETIDGRVVYQDTNNSTADFVESSVAQ